MMNEKQIKDKIYELEREISVYKKVLETPSDGRLGRPKGTTYSIEQIKFLEECEKLKLSDKVIINQWNKQFGEKLPENSRQLYNIMVRLNIRKQTT